MKFSLFLILVAISIFQPGCNGSNSTDKKSTMDSTSSTMNIKEDSVTISSDGHNYKGFVAYDDNIKGKRPGVLIVHEWWGPTDYVRMRAKKLAELGYIALAVDMYGDGKMGTDPKLAQALATPFYTNPQLTFTMLNPWISKIKEYPQTDTSKLAAIGYCYGGYVVLNAAKLGADLKGVVSFHGNLGGVPFDKQLLKAKILVCHGAADSFVKKEEVDGFRHAADSVGADYTFKAYPNATHAFTNPAATENGIKFKMPIEYNGAADTASWNDMKTFFTTIFK